METNEATGQGARGMTAAARVTIGMPVFNSAPHLRAAVDSILAQTYRDFELVVSDNASTDATGDIVRDYAQRDARVRYIRQSRNIGAPANWNFVVGAARGTYFKWASGNDVVPPTMLARCVEVMDRDPQVVLAYGHTQLIDDAGNALQIYPGDIDVRDRRASDRFARICNELAMNNAQCGLIRLATLRSTRLDRPYPAGDMVLMAELALHGHFALLPEVLLLRRTTDRSSSSRLSATELSEFFDPGRRARDAAGYLAWRKHFDYLRTSIATRNPWPERLAAFRHALRHMVWARPHLGAELRRGLTGIFRR